jgi:hypothetical protein
VTGVSASIRSFGPGIYTKGESFRWIVQSPDGEILDVGWTNTAVEAVRKAAAAFMEHTS